FWVWLGNPFNLSASLPSPVPIHLKALTEGPMAMDTSVVGLRADKADYENHPWVFRFNQIWDCSSIG
ncbi:MAG: hypothetical protein ACK535_13280, partial [Cyanobacteriota bacterium]